MIYYNIKYNITLNTLLPNDGIVTVLISYLVITSYWVRMLIRDKRDQSLRSARTKGCTCPFNWAIIKLMLWSLE